MREYLSLDIIWLLKLFPLSFPLGNWSLLETDSLQTNIWAYFCTKWRLLFIYLLYITMHSLFCSISPKIKLNKIGRNGMITCILCTVEKQFYYIMTWQGQFWTISLKTLIRIIAKNFWYFRQLLTWPKY